MPMAGKTMADKTMGNNPWQLRPWQVSPWREGAHGRSPWREDKPVADKPMADIFFCTNASEVASGDSVGAMRALNFFYTKQTFANNDI